MTTIMPISKDSKNLAVLVIDINSNNQTSPSQCALDAIDPSPSTIVISLPTKTTAVHLFFEIRVSFETKVS